MPGTNRALLVAFATAGLMLAAAPAGAVCYGVGAMQTCSDGLGRTYTTDQETRHVVPLNKPLLASKPAEKVQLPADNTSKPTDQAELKAADKALNFVSMYPGFAASAKSLTPLSR